jgi:membrane protein implicated in regulation of membrane protease activity
VRTFSRYLLFQLPGWAVVGLLLAGLSALGVLDTGIATAVFVVWVSKDFLLYPLLRRAYEPGEASPAARLVDSEALARHGLEREGYVELHGELWRAELAPGEPPVPPGQRVRVRDVRGLTLLVTSAAPHP